MARVRKVSLRILSWCGGRAALHEARVLRRRDGVHVQQHLPHPAAHLRPLLRRQPFLQDGALRARHTRRYLVARPTPRLEQRLPALPERVARHGRSSGDDGGADFRLFAVQTTGSLDPGLRVPRCFTHVRNSVLQADGASNILAAAISSHNIYLSSVTLGL